MLCRIGEMPATDHKTIELRGGHADGRRVSVQLGFTQITVQVNSADKFSAWIIYRPTSERCADGVEIWSEYAETNWGDSDLVPL
jgi:hypothetical protein